MSLVVVIMILVVVVGVLCKEIFGRGSGRGDVVVVVAKSFAKMWMLWWW